VWPKRSYQEKVHPNDMALRAALKATLFATARANATSLSRCRSSGHPDLMTCKQIAFTQSTSMCFAISWRPSAVQIVYPDDLSACHKGNQNKYK